MPDSSMRDQASMNIRTELATVTQPARADVTTSSAPEDFFSFGLQTLPAEIQDELSRYLLVPGDAPAPETGPNPGPVGGPVPEGAPATQLDPGPGPRGAPAPDAEVDRCRSRRGGLGPVITNTGASHHGPTESVKVQRKR
ncbi:hypothetical protein MTO96_017162 [Rhipicephalus appendiculatus]